jgi:hypothetical protein
MSRSAALLAILLAAPMGGDAATIMIVNTDTGTGRGFDDSTPVAPVGGNPGVTLGQQRLFVFQRAAEVWGALLESSVEIKVEATFAPITSPQCTANSAVLGQAGPSSMVRFPADNTPAGAQPNVSYPVALANALGGSDFNGVTAEIWAKFNSEVDSATCLGTTDWWYGVDASALGTIGDDRALFPVVLHELAHGLGFLTTTCLQPSGCGDVFGYGDFGSATISNGVTTYFPDVWAALLKDKGSGSRWTEMSSAQRGASSLNDPNLVWAGPRVTADAQLLMQQTDAARHATSGELRMHAPAVAEPGSSVSHFTVNGLTFGIESVGTIPLLMRPRLSQALFDDPDLTVSLFRDIGWKIIESGPTISPSSPAAGSSTAMNGGIVGTTVSRNILFSVDGGAGAATTALVCVVTSGTVAITSGTPQSIAVGGVVQPVVARFTLTLNSQSGVIACTASPQGGLSSVMTYTFTAPPGTTSCIGACVHRSGFEPGET